jgi:hypothetical protein
MFRFGPVPVAEAVGKLLGHNVTGADGRPLLRKGRALTPADVAALVALGRATVYVAEPGQGDVTENDAARRVAEAAMGPGLRLVGPYTGRAMTPLATIDLVGWDIHRAIVDNVHENTRDEARATLELPAYMAKLMGRGVLGNKSGAGFFKREGKTSLALDPKTGDYRPVAELALPKLDYIDRVAALHSVGRYAEGLQAFLAAEGPEAETARRVIAGYISYAFHRVGEVTDTITGIDMIMATGFNWAPPSVLVDLMGARAAVEMIEQAGLPVPTALRDAAKSGTPKRFFQHPQLNVGKFFVAS